MTNIILLSFVFLFAMAATPQNHKPDLSKTEDLKMLGTGRIIQKDNSILKNIHLLELNAYWIIYEKNSSSHDMMMDVISRIEFPESKWGAVKLEFPDNKPALSQMFN